MRAACTLLSLAVVMAGCSTTATAPPSPSTMSPSSSMPSPSSSVSKDKPPRLADARLQGSWSLVFKNRGKAKALINFDPTCNEGSCDVVAKTDPSIRLRRKGTLYSGGRKGSFGSTCSGSGIKSSVDLSLRVKRATMEGRKWLATVVTGTLHQSVSPQRRCSGTKRNYGIKGTPTNASPQGHNDLPTIALYRPEPELEAAPAPSGPDPVIAPYCPPWYDPTEVKHPFCVVKPG